MNSKSAATPSTRSIAPWPFFAQDELEAVQRVLQSGKVNYWTGEEGRRFEKEFAASSGCAHAIVLANGTVALELALIGLEIPAGSEVITSPRTFIASASAIVARGCVPILADVDPETGNITAETIAKVVTPQTRAVIAVHLAGWPCDMDPIMALAAKHDFKVIEDCAQATGASYKGRPVGSIGHAGAFSFCQDKIITTGGEGGMLTTNDEKVWNRAWSYKDHGKNFDSVYHREHAPGFRWLHDSFGTNWRMVEMQAAIGRKQLAKLVGWVEARTANAQFLAKCFSSFSGLRVPMPSEGFHHSWYKFYVYVRPECLSPGWTRDRIMTTIAALGAPCFSGSCSEIYREKAFTEAQLGPQTPLPVAKELGETSLMFLVHPNLTEEDMDFYANLATSVFNEAFGFPRS